MDTQQAVLWTAESKAHFRAIMAHYDAKLGSTEYSNKLIEEMYRLASHLPEMPYLGRTSGVKPYRKICKFKLCLYYIAEENPIVIYGVLDSRMSIAKVREFLP